MAYRTIIVTLLAALTVAATSTTATATTTACNDLGYLKVAVKVSNKHIASLKLAKRARYSAALVPARAGLAMIKASPEPCESSYWLDRRYETKYSVAIIRWLEEKRDGDNAQADVYWSSVEFWGDAIRDNQLEW